MKNEIQIVYENRLKNVLIKDKQDNPNRITNILKSEILNVLKNYLEVMEDNLDIFISVDELGYYILNINAKARRIKSVSSFLS